MTTHRILIGLTIINVVLLISLLLSQIEPALANTRPTVLRGSALEIVDDRGRIRASIKVQPAETFEQTGMKYPETVVLRLIDPNGRPEVKLAASVEGGGLSFVGNSDATRVLLHADGNNSRLTLTNNAARERVIEP
jgi:hypothetical protein